MHRTDGRRLCALLTLLAALLLSGCVRTQPPDESDGGTAPRYARARAGRQRH